MANGVGFLIFSLAVYRLATDLALTSGPFGLYEHWRGWAMLKWHQHVWVNEGVHCPICLSFWIGLVGALALVATGLPLIEGVWWWLGGSGLAAFLHRVGE